MLRREWKPLFPKKTRRLQENRDPGTVFTLQRSGVPVPHFAIHTLSPSLSRYSSSLEGMFITGGPGTKLCATVHEA